MNAKSPSTSKHTPGPWYCHGGAIYMRPFPDTSGCIANMDREEPETAPWERDANARLIAAAPELLEVVRKAMIDLEDCLEHSSHLPEQVRMNATASIEQARAIIAKAEGGANV